MHLFIVRHGECVGQTEAVFTTPDTVLTPLGERQALLTAQRLATECVTCLLSSPLVRALHTASTIADAVGDYPVEVWLELRELWDVVHRGYGRAELLRRFPRAVLPPSVTDGGWDHGGDTGASVFGRCEAVLRMLRERFGPDDRVLMVTHGGFANYLLHAILHIPHAAPQWFHTDNSSISKIRLVPERERRAWPPLYPAVEAEILYLNDVSHLSGIGGLSSEADP